MVCRPAAAVAPHTRHRRLLDLLRRPWTQTVISEEHRVIKPGGFLPFSITHPRFDTPHRRCLRDQEGITSTDEIGDYFRNLEGDVEEWTFGAAPPEALEDVPPFKTPRFRRTLSQWLNLPIGESFRLERVAGPRPSDEAVRDHPNI